MGLYRVTIAGLYEWNNTLFDKMEFPESADRQNFIDSLLLYMGIVSHFIQTGILCMKTPSLHGARSGKEVLTRFIMC